MKKRLLITASTFPRWENDTEPRFVLDLAKSLSREFDVTVLAPMNSGLKVREVIEGIKVERYHYFPIHRYEQLCYPGAIAARIKEKKGRVLLVPFLFLALYIKLYRMRSTYDIVHAHWLLPQGIVQSFIKKPYIVTGHGGDVTSMNAPFIKALKRKCIERAGKVTVVSQALKEVVEQNYNKQDVEIISMGCNTKAFSSRYRKEDYFNQKGKKVVLFVGRLEEIKGVSYLIKALQGLEVKLVVVGEGTLRNELEQEALSHKIDATFLGAKTHEELRCIYASADVFCAPSITMPDGAKEGLGLVVVEAMASGLIPVVSDSGGLKELVRNMETGYVVPEKNIVELRQGIKSALKDEPHIRKMKESILDDIAKRDYEYIGDQYSRLIYEVLDEFK